MGAGLHGANGINPIISLHIWNIFVRPRMLFGLETLSLSSTDLVRLGKHQTKFIKQIQTLHDRTANVAAFALIGAEPIETAIDKAKLTLFGQILHQQSSIEYELARRQVAVKNADSCSWFVGLRHILKKYNLPSIFDLIDHPPSKFQWKEQVKEAVGAYWMNIWQKEAESLPSIRYMNFENCGPGKPMLVWSSLKGSPKDIKKAIIKVRLLTGSYNLQANRARFNQNAVDPTCKLCRTHAEDRRHFLLHCNALKAVRSKYMSKLGNLLEVNVSEDLSTVLRSEEDQLLQCILDCSKILRNCSEAILSAVERITRDLTYALHARRNSLLNELHPNSDDYAGPLETRRGEIPMGQRGGNPL